MYLAKRQMKLPVKEEEKQAEMVGLPITHLKVIEPSANVGTRENEAKSASSVVPTYAVELNARDDEQGPNTNDKIVDDKEIILLEQQLECCKKQMKDIKQAEMSRISRTYAEPSHGHLHGVTQKVLISALVGDDDTKLEFDRQQQDRQDYLRNQANRATFHFGRHILKHKLRTRKIHELIDTHFE